MKIVFYINENEQVDVQAVGTDWSDCVSHLSDDCVRAVVMHCRLKDKSHRVARILWCGDNVPRLQRVNLSKFRTMLFKLVSVSIF